MSLDRAAVQRQAEKLLRQGKLDLAIDELRRLVAEHPRDWSTVNQLGDLLARAGRVDDAAAAFTQIADDLAAQGFLARASAVYKKILKLAPHHDHSLTQAAELAVAQGLLVDARSFFRAAAARRAELGDHEGALRVAVRLGEIDPSDTEARIESAQALMSLGELPAALARLQELAACLLDAGEAGQARRVLETLLDRDPGDGWAAGQLARLLVAQGEREAARAYLTPAAVAQVPELAMEAADWRLRQGDEATAWAMLDPILYAGDAAAASAVGALAAGLADEVPDAALHLAERVTDACILRNDWAGAVQVLRLFVERQPTSVRALSRLVEVCVDAGLADALLDAQVRLAEAYLATGAAGEARVVAEDLLVRQPDEPAHRGRLRRALMLAGDPDPDRTIADWAAQRAGDDVELVIDHEWVPQPAPLAERRGETPDASDLEFIELTDALDAAGAGGEATAGFAEPQTGAAPDLDEVFADLRASLAQADTLAPGELSLRRGMALFDAGAFEASVDALRSAAREPALRFTAATLLARVYQHQRRPDEAIVWLGHAADALVSRPEDRHRVLLRLASLLEESGERERALGVCLELQADAGDFEDVAQRIVRLSGGHA